MFAKDIFTTDPLIDAENVYTSFDEAPLEDELALKIGDGDEEVHLANEGHGFGAAPMLMHTPFDIKRNLIVPLPRTQKFTTPRMAGRDVLAQQRALSKAGLRKWGRFTGYYGKSNKQQIAAFQERVHLTRDGVYGPSTHAKLARYYDNYGAYLMLKYQHTVLDSPRQLIVNMAMFGYNNRASIHYTQSSLRMYGVKNHVHPPRIPYYEDCSSFATWCYYAAGQPDPNHLGYSGYGFTGTLASHGYRVVVPQKADLALYGSFYPYHHVTIALGNDRCISHGNEYGPLLLSLHYRGDLNQCRSYF